MRKFLTLLLPLYLLIGCSSLNECCNYTRFTRTVVDSFVSDMQTQHGLVIWGSGGGMMDDVNNITLDFICRDRLDVIQCRRLHLSVCEDLLMRLNAETHLRPFLHEYPATHRLISIDLSFMDTDMIDFDDEFIDSVMMIDDRVLYLRSNSSTDRLDTVHEETYTEALEIVRAQSANSG